MFKEHEDYQKLITKKADEFRKAELTEEYLPKAMFEPKMLLIREKRVQFRFISICYGEANLIAGLQTSIF